MKIKILVVDDNESIINMVGSYFKNNTKAEVVKSIRKRFGVRHSTFGFSYAY